MRTTQKKFWEVLATIKFVKIKGTIRLKGKPGVCPVCAVANVILGKDTWALCYVSAANAIGLDSVFAGKVVQAADHSRWTPDSPVLKKLLKVTGIKEVKK